MDSNFQHEPKISKVLITGGTGLVGKALQRSQYMCPEWEDGWVFLSSKDGDLTNEETVKALFEKHKPDMVVHLAANVGGLFKNMNQKATMYEDNLLMNTYVLKYARIYKVKKVISMLSTCIFPDGYEPLTEKVLHEGPPHPSNEGYAYAKRMLDVHSRILESEGILSICLVPTNIYGPHDNFNLQDAHVMPALIHRCYLAKQNNEPFVVKGSGKPIRQFIYSGDLARMILWAMYYCGTSGRYICSPTSESEVTIEYVARTVAKSFDYEHAIQFDTSCADGQFKKTVEPNPVFKEMTFMSLDEGIQKTVEWFQEAYEKGTARV
jgi:GDP-L-fucose synthase